MKRTEYKTLCCKEITLSFPYKHRPKQEKIKYFPTNAAQLFVTGKREYTLQTKFVAM